MRWGTVLASFVLILAACLGPPAKDEKPEDPYRNYTTIFPPADAAGVSVREPNCTSGAGCSEYYFVQVSGSENVTQVKGTPAQHGTCKKPFRFEAHAANQTVVYNASLYEIDRRNLKTVIGESMYSVTITGRRYVDGCPSVYALHPFYPTTQYPYPQRTISILGNYGAPVKFSVYRDGTLAFGPTDKLVLVDLGKKLVVSYGRLIASSEGTFYVKGGFEIVNRGPWPMDGLIAGSGAPVSQGPG